MMVSINRMTLSLLIAAASFAILPVWIFVSMAWIVNIRTRAVIKVIKSLQGPD